MKIEAASVALPRESAASALSTATSRIAEAPTKVEPGTFEKALARAGEQVSAHEQQIHALTHGGGAAALSPEQMLALQSDVYRYSATVDLTTKLVSQGTQGVQTVLKGGGQ